MRARRPRPGLPHRRQPPPVKPPGRALVRRTFLTGAVPDSYTFNGHVTNVYDWRLLQSNRGPAIHAPNFESPPFGGSAAGPPVASKPRDTPCRLTPKRETLGVQKNDRFVEPAVGHPLRPTCSGRLWRGSVGLLSLPDRGNPTAVQWAYALGLTERCEVTARPIWRAASGCRKPNSRPACNGS